MKGEEAKSWSFQLTRGIQSSKTKNQDVGLTDVDLLTVTRENQPCSWNTGDVEATMLIRSLRQWGVDTERAQILKFPSARELQNDDLESMFRGCLSLLLQGRGGKPPSLHTMLERLLSESLPSRPSPLRYSPPASWKRRLSELEGQTGRVRLRAEGCRAAKTRLGKTFTPEHRVWFFFFHRFYVLSM